MQLHRGLVVALIALLWLVQPPSAAAQGGRDSVAGSWVGVYEAYPSFIRMTLQIPSATAAATAAELRLEPLVDIRTVGRSPAGVINVTVEYDAAIRIMRITPGADAYRVLGMQVPQFDGVFDDDKQTIGGLLVPASASASPYFVMAHAEAAESFLKPLREIITERGTAPAARPQQGPRITVPGRPAGRIQLPLRVGGGISEGKLREWTSRFMTEYPDVDPYHSESGALGLMTRNLFRDDFFRPYFGKTFDELDRSHMNDITMELRRIPPPRGNLPEERANSVLKSIERAFMPTGTYGAPDIMLSVIALRPIQAWMAASVRRLGTLTPTIDSLRTVSGIGSAEQTELHTMWPSEQRTFADAVTGARAKIVGPVLVQRVDELLASTTSIDSAQKLAVALEQSKSSATGVAPVDREGRGKPSPGVGRPAPVVRRAGRAAASGPAVDDSLPSLMAMADPDQRQAQAARIESRVTEMVDAEVQKDRQTLSRLGDGASGLESGVKWLTDINRKYGPLTGQPSVVALVDELGKRRVPQFHGGESVINARLQAAKSSGEVGTVVATYLSVPSDFRDPIGSRLLSAAQQRGSQFKTTESVAAQRAEADRRTAASVCAKAATTRDDEREPTEREMCYALEARLTGAQELSADLATACKDMRSNDPTTAMACLMGKMGQIGGGPQMSIRLFRKVACTSAAPAGRPGFFCDYSARLETGNQMLAGMINRLPGEDSTGRFVKSNGVWLFFPSK